MDEYKEFFYKISPGQSQFLPVRLWDSTGFGWFAQLVQIGLNLFWVFLFLLDYVGTGSLTYRGTVVLVTSNICFDT